MAWTRWLLLVVIYALGCASSARAQEAELSLASAYEGPGAGFHVGQAAGGALVGVGVALTGAGLWSMTRDGYLSQDVGALGVGLGGLTAGVGSLAALGAAEGLRRQGILPSRTAGWIALGATGIELTAVGLYVATQEPALVGVSLAAVPVVLVATTTQLVLNAHAARQGPLLGLGLQPIPGGGRATVALRW